MTDLIRRIKFSTFNKYKSGGAIEKFKDPSGPINPKRRINFNNVSTSENRNRYVPVEAMELFQDSLIGRNYPEPQRLALLATALLEIGRNGAASKGVGGNGYLGLSSSRMPTSYLDDTPEGRGKLIHFLLDNLEHIIGSPNNNWTGGNSEPPKVMNALDGYNKFWNANNAYDATLYLNKSYIRPAGNRTAWINRANIANNLWTKLK